MFLKKATKFDRIFTVDLTVCSKCQIDSEDFTKFCGLLREHELYETKFEIWAGFRLAGSTEKFCNFDKVSN